MEFFARAKAVRLRSQHNKFLVAAEDEESVRQSRNGSSKNSRWFVEAVDNKPNVIRLKNAQSWKYLRATDDPYLLGMTGRRVGQSSPRLRLDPTVEWEPIREGSHVKLRTRKGNFLRANGGIPPWNNSVTHDVPSRSATQDWVLWTVDVLEVEHESTDEMKGSNTNNVVEDVKQEFLSRNSSTSSTISKVDFYKDCHEVIGSETPSDYQMKKNSKEYNNVESDTEEYKECISDKAEVVTPSAPKSVRSVRHYSNAQLPTQSPNAIPQETGKPKRVTPVGHHVHNEPQHSDSFNKLKSALDGLDDLLNDDDDDEHDTESEAESEPMAEPTLHRPHLLEVKMAKHTLKELKDLDYETVLSLGKEKKLIEAVNVLITDAKMSGSGQVPTELETLEDHLKSMRQDHDSASQDIEEYTTFSIRRLEVKGELKKDATKAHELEALEVGLSNTLVDAKAKRDELLKQLEEVENTIKATEKAQADNALKIDEIVSRIGEKSESLREMERNEKSWQARKVEAERKLERVEGDWAKMQSLFEDV
ncbi:hypothetical protein vseg_014227 [Gypsophila vaccaria]